MNWAGFYVLDSSTPDQLILGPFQGKVACQTIAFGRGVCGAAAQSKQTQLVPDVEDFPGHIACDGDSKSEIVVPIVKDGRVSDIISFVTYSLCCWSLTLVRARWSLSSTLTAQSRAVLKPRTSNRLSS